MCVHNTVEDSVISRVDEVFKTLNEEGNRKFCTCNQCRMDVICYALNRLRPHYIASHRGASRNSRDSIEKQQQTADIAAMIHEGLQRVSHNQRSKCSNQTVGCGQGQDVNLPVFNIPTIIGRLFSGSNFSPISGINVELLCNGELAPMIDGNWHNPYNLVSNAEGTFSFWPAPVKASGADDLNVFSFTLRISSPEYELLTHFFKIPVASEMQTVTSFSQERTFKLPDLYLFPPGEAEKNDNVE